MTRPVQIIYRLYSCLTLTIYVSQKLLNERLSAIGNIYTMMLELLINFSIQLLKVAFKGLEFNND